MIWAALLGCGAGSERPSGLIDRSYLEVGVDCAIKTQGPPEEYVYVVDTASDQVWVVNPRTCTVVTRIAVGDEPVFANASLSGRWVYTANRADHSLSIIDTDTNQTSSSVALGFPPTSMWFGGRRRHLWIVGHDQTAIFDTQSQSLTHLDVRSPPTMTGSAPPVGVVHGPTGLEVRAVADGELLRSSPGRADALAYSAAEDRMIGCADGHVIDLDPLEGTVSRGEALPGRCFQVRLEDCSNRGLVVTDGAVVLLEATKPIRALPIVADRGDWASGIAVLTESAAGRVHLIGTEGATRTVDVGSWTSNRQIRVSLDRRHVYVLRDHELVIVDTEQASVRGRVHVGEDPRAVIVAGPIGGTCC